MEFAEWSWEDPVQVQVNRYRKPDENSQDDGAFPKVDQGQSAANRQPDGSQEIEGHQQSPAFVSGPDGEKGQGAEYPESQPQPGFRPDAVTDLGRIGAWDDPGDGELLTIALDAELDNICL